MEITDKILTYLKDKYQPDAIIAYGSFADGSANKNSDFDALVIADKERMHDSSVIDGMDFSLEEYFTNYINSGLRGQ